MSYSSYPCHFHVIKDIYIYTLDNIKAFEMIETLHARKLLKSLRPLYSPQDPWGQEDPWGNLKFEARKKLYATKTFEAKMTLILYVNNLSYQAHFPTLYVLQWSWNQILLMFWYLPHIPYQRLQILFEYILLNVSLNSHNICIFTVFPVIAFL